jgi:hypothetical protein
LRVNLAQTIYYVTVKGKFVRRLNTAGFGAAITVYVTAVAQQSKFHSPNPPWQPGIAPRPNTKLPPHRIGQVQINIDKQGKPTKKG